LWLDSGRQYISVVQMIVSKHLTEGIYRWYKEFIIVIQIRRVDGIRYINDSVLQLTAVAINVDKSTVVDKIKNTMSNKDNKLRIGL
jgi:hypothetical protein